MVTAISTSRTGHELDGKEAETLIGRVDALRVTASKKASERSRLGQFPTPIAISRYMASLFQQHDDTIRLLDAGAGVGSLTAAFVEKMCNAVNGPLAIDITAFEIDAELAVNLETCMALSARSCDAAGIRFSSEVRSEDFIRSAVEMLEGGLFGRSRQGFNRVIMNPPYKKLNTESDHRHLLRRVGIETSNLYTAFLGLAVLLLERGGELVAITPRSFCNGPYFKPFRRMLLRETSIRRVHVFESRTMAFAEDEVLQESIILHVVKGRNQSKHVIISSSQGPDDEPTTRRIAYEELVKPGDSEQFIHIVSDESGRNVSNLMGRLTHSLVDLGMTVSTGRVVDFRSRSFLRANPDPGTVPLIYPAHVADGRIDWPKLGHKKPNACVLNDQSDKWLIPAAIHVLVKRFSAKEETRRVVAAVFDPSQVRCEYVAFENHLNYFHEKGKGLSLSVARGLSGFLNSSMVDAYFRQFNGHTQVNATDLRSLRYPSRGELELIGAAVGQVLPPQQDLDRIVEREVRAWRSGDSLLQS